jgi:hypothetical protein
MPDDLDQLRRRHQALAARLGQIGFALPGSITRRYTRCGKPGCRCQASPPRPPRPLLLKFRTYATAASQAASTARICSSVG